MSGLEKNTIIDLTKPLDKSFIPFAAGKYCDPPLDISEWSSVTDEGFRVSRISMGTQSGTHMDAPAHFLDDGATLDLLSPDHFVGNYFLLDLPLIASASDVAKRLDAYRHEKILFLRTPEHQAARLSFDVMQKILSLPPLLWVLSGEIEIEHVRPLEFHRIVARAGKFLVEDLDQHAAHLVSGCGEMFALPLRLTGVSGSPCRVIVRTQA